MDGYAPFCKHIFVPNFVGAKLGALPIKDTNRHLLRCGYSRRRPEELPVLTRWDCKLDLFVAEPASQPIPQKKYSAERTSKKSVLVYATDHVLLAARTDRYSGSCWAEKHFMRRWFPADDVEVPEAKFLDVILYSREQLVQEYEAMPGKGDPAALPASPWGIISIKAQDEDFETPMQVTPIFNLSCL